MEMLADEHQSALDGLREAVFLNHLSDDVRARTFRSYLEAADSAQQQSLLREVLSNTSSPLAPIALSQLAERPPELTTLLIESLDSDVDHNFAHGLLELFRRRYRSGDLPLLTQLARHQSRDIRLTAVGVMGCAGGAAELAELADLADADASLSAGIAEAQGDIRRRTQGKKGQLSILQAEDTSAAVSLVDDASGAVSDPEDV